MTPKFHETRTNGYTLPPPSPSPHPKLTAHFYPIQKSQKIIHLSCQKLKNDQNLKLKNNFLTPTSPLIPFPHTHLLTNYQSPRMAQLKSQYNHKLQPQPPKSPPMPNPRPHPQSVPLGKLPNTNKGVASTCQALSVEPLPHPKVKMLN